MNRNGPKPTSLFSLRLLEHTHLNWPTTGLLLWHQRRPENARKVSKRSMWTSHSPGMDPVPRVIEGVTHDVCVGIVQLPEHTADLVVPQGCVGGIHHHDKLHLGVGDVAVPGQGSRTCSHTAGPGTARNQAGLCPEGQTERKHGGTSS